jgi:hypothetical protein
VRPWLYFALFCLPLSLVAQHQPGTELSIQRATSIRLDGVLDEEAWSRASVARDFFLNFPNDSLPPTFPTEVRLTFDDHHLYVGIVCFDDDRPNVVQSLRRDFVWELNDAFGVFIDPYDDHTNGFYFMVTPMGVQKEGVVSGGGYSDGSYNDSWDNKWYSKVTRLHDRWVAELAIPFKSFRYNSEAANWNITFVRNDLKRNQVSSWIRTPIQFIPSSFAYSGKLMWEQRPPKAGTNISLIPYVASTVSEDQENNVPRDYTGAIGFDAKVAITPSMNLDLTVNPDFSNVEVDRQVINLTRFEFGFPERRQFFLENNDLFATPGYPDTRPFFSRRLGIARDSSGNTKKVPILYGARVSGKLGSNWRLGVMNLQTKETKSLGLPAQNYTVAVVQRQVFSRSNVDIVFIDKESLGLGDYDRTRYYHPSLLNQVKRGTETDTVLNRYNRVIGVDFNLFSKSNRWNGDFYYFHSFDEISTSNQYSYGGFLSRNTRNLNVYGGYTGLGKNFRAETGFVPQLDVYPGYGNGFMGIETPWYPQSERVVKITPGLDLSITHTPDGRITDRVTSADFGIDFKNTAGFGMSIIQTHQVLTTDFNPIDMKKYQLMSAGESFTWHEFSIGYNSDTRKAVTWDGGILWGTFYNGHRTTFNGSLSYRYQPFGSVAVNFEYNDIRLPDGYGSPTLFLISPRFDFTFTDKLFLTTFVQYNDTQNNVNLNARFQWRFKPASDFFVVYTENYLPEPFVSKNRALVLKLTYWLNL